MDKWYKPHMNKQEWKRSEKQTVHHQFPGSRGWSQEEENKVLLYRSFHEAFHRVHWNATPQEQLLQILSINYWCLTHEFTQDVLNILSETDNKYYYKDGILLPNWEIKNHNKK